MNLVMINNNNIYIAGVTSGNLDGNTFSGGSGDMFLYVSITFAHASPYIRACVHSLYTFLT